MSIENHGIVLDAPARVATGIKWGKGPALPKIWSESFEVGVPTIDAQHAEFLELCEELEHALGRGAEGAEIVRLCLHLADHSKRHFSDEENMLMRSGYSLARTGEFIAHKHQHKELFRTIDHALDMIRESSDPAKVAVSLKMALLEHLLRWDMMYKEFLEGKGDSP